MLTSIRMNRVNIMEHLPIMKRVYIVMCCFVLIRCSYQAWSAPGRSFVRFNTHAKQRDYLRGIRGASVWLYTLRPPALPVWLGVCDLEALPSKVFVILTRPTTYKNH